MEKYQKYYGVIGFVVALIVLVAIVCALIVPKVNEIKSLDSSIASNTTKLDGKRQERARIEAKKKKLHDSIVNSQKKIYSPIDTGLEKDTLFFTLYNDVIEMLHANSVKIKSINYEYNPSSDSFVKFGKDVYFVCDVNMEVVSNYVNLGKFIQDIYQYPYYIKINNIEINPYKKDKKILITNISLRLYAHTSPDEFIEEETAPTLEGAEKGLPQE